MIPVRVVVYVRGQHRLYEAYNAITGNKACLGAFHSRQELGQAMGTAYLFPDELKVILSEHEPTPKGMTGCTERMVRSIQLRVCSKVVTVDELVRVYAVATEGDVGSIVCIAVRKEG